MTATQKKLKETPVISEDLDIVITRTFNAPRALVWKVWTETDHIEKWWGPKGFSTRVEKNELKVGGRSRYIMVGPDGTEYPAEGTFKEIVPFEKIVTTDEFGEGHDMPDNGDLPQGMIATYLFEDASEKKTRVTVRISHPDAEEKRKHEKMGVVGGWNSMLDCLDEHLATLK
jgi:uncharacterized protein YndB with AHSA1/START domain